MSSEKVGPKKCHFFVPCNRPFYFVRKPFTRSRHHHHTMVLIPNSKSLVVTTSCWLLATTNQAQGLIQSGSVTSRSSLIHSRRDMSFAADKDPLVQKKRTLYDLLGANPSDSRTQLKQRYVAMAKLYHPDALRHSGDRIVVDDTIDFSEVAAAWRVLGNKQLRTRYDRSLRAEEASESFLKWMDEVAEQAIPFVMDVARSTGDMFSMFWNTADGGNHGFESQSIDHGFTSQAIEEPTEIVEPPVAFSSHDEELQYQRYLEHYNLYMIWYEEELKRMTRDG